MGRFESALKWAALCGAAGFSMGFFGPILFNPEANQGPLLGIFITGPGGAALGFLLGLLPLERRTRLAIFAALAAAGFAALFYYGGPTPKNLGHALDGEVTACEESVSRLPESVARWEEAVRRSTRRPREGWKEDASAALRRDPGVVVTLRAARWTSLHQGRRFWNEGERWAGPWRGPRAALRAYARKWKTCAEVPSETRGLYLVKDPQRDDWPAENAPGLLRLSLMEDMPADLRAVLPPRE